MEETNEKKDETITEVDSEIEKLRKRAQEERLKRFDRFGEVKMITGEALERLKDIIAQREQAKYAVQVFMADMQRADKDLWQAIHAIHPDLDQYESNFNHLTGELKVGKRLLKHQYRMGEFDNEL